MEETVSDIQGVNVVINETLKVQEKTIENLREDLCTQEDMEVVEISIENNAGNSCNKYDYVASKSVGLNLDSHIAQCARNALSRNVS